MSASGVAVRYLEWGLSECASIDNTIEINLQMLCFALMCAGKQCILLDMGEINKRTNNFFLCPTLFV